MTKHWDPYYYVATLSLKSLKAYVKIAKAAFITTECLHCKIIMDYGLSSPRAESARAVTGRRNSHSGRGEDFLTGQPNFFTETAVTPERKVEKSFPRWEINRHVEG